MCIVMTTAINSCPKVPAHIIDFYECFKSNNDILIERMLFGYCLKNLFWRPNFIILRIWIILSQKL